MMFLVFFIVLHWLVFPLFSSYEWIFGFSQSSANQILGISLLILASTISFVIFSALCSDRRIGLGVAVFGSAVPLLFSQTGIGLMLAGIYLLALISIYFLVEHTMKHYLSFSPITLLIPPIKTLSTILLLVICLGYYLSINVVIKEKGFEVPESIIPDAFVEQLINQQTSQFVKGDRYIAQLPQLTPEQLELLKQNPDLLRQYGVDPAILDQYETTTPPAATTTKPAAKPGAIQVPTTNALPLSVAAVKKMALSPINTLINEYKFLVAPFLALILFSAVSFFFFLFFLFNLISGGLMKTIFYILEKTKFIHFEKELREVQKLVV